MYKQDGFLCRGLSDINGEWHFVGHQDIEIQIHAIHQTTHISTLDVPVVKIAMQLNSSYF